MNERLSLIAGRGALVSEVVAAARRRGYAVQLLRLGRARSTDADSVVSVSVTDPQVAIDAVRAFGATRLAMAGGVRLSDVVREGLARFARGGEAASLPTGDTGLSGLVHDLSRLTGAAMIGVHEIAPELLAPEGHIAGPALEPGVRDLARHALTLARRLGALDIGQGVVVCGRRAIAAEDISGTDALLARIRRFRLLGLTAGGQSPLILAKTAKPDQPLEVDLPAIGPKTIVNARKAGIRVIAVQAEASLLVDRRTLASQADRAGIAVVGLQVEDD